jgi:hypothetical protein
MDFLRRGYAALLTSGSQVLLLFFGARVGTPMAWRMALTLMAAVSLLAWLSNLRRLRALTDTPLSSIASAAQGYVELRGRGKPFSGLPVVAPPKGLTCLWYRLHVDRRSGDKWVRDTRDESDASFLLDDGTGVCVVDPQGAEILPARCEKWQEGDYRYIQWLIIENDPIAVTGSLRTRNAGEFDRTVSDEVKDLLADWKQDKTALLQQFDRNHDGTVDMSEWELARIQARLEVEDRRRQDIGKSADLHLVGKPEGGQPFLISTLSPDKLERRYRLWAWLQLAIFFVALIGLAKVSVPAWHLPS